jgi:hypothetical protein
MATPSVAILNHGAADLGIPRVSLSAGWYKTIGGLARPMLRGVARLRFKFILTMAAYDLIRLPKLMAASA